MQTTPLLNSPTTQYSLPGLLLSGTVLITGVVGTIIPFVEIPEQTYRWTRFTLSVITTFGGIWGLWKSRTEVPADTAKDEDSERIYRIDLKTISKNLDEIKYQLVPEKTQILEESIKTEISSLYIQNQIKEIKTLVVNQKQELSKANKTIEEYDAVMLNVEGLSSNSSSAVNTPINSPMKIPFKKQNSQKIPFNLERKDESDALCG